MNPQHIALLRKGPAAWNEWRAKNPKTKPDLRHANLTKMDLRKVNLYQADLFGVNLVRGELRMANLIRADVRKADLTQADLSNTFLAEADFSDAVLKRADLPEADLTGANLRKADLRGADLRGARLVRTCLEKANLEGCSIYGISAWELDLREANQSNLVITPPHLSTVTVDNLQVAQFIYLLVNNKNVRDVLDTITSKVVLILGRFTAERKMILDAIREELRRRNFVPILFDFDKPSKRDVTETISTLAHIAKFVIADLTGAKSIPQELQSIVPDLPSVPIQPILHASAGEYGMFEHFKRYPWVLAIHRYRDLPDLLANLSPRVIAPAEAKAKELNP